MEKNALGPRRTTHNERWPASTAEGRTGFVGRPRDELIGRAVEPSLPLWSTYTCAVPFRPTTCANEGMQGKWIGLVTLLILAPCSRQAAAEDPIRLSAERGNRIAAELRDHGFLCLRATTLKRTIARLDGRRTYRVACGADGGAPVYFVTMPPGQRLGRP